MIPPAVLAGLLAALSRGEVGGNLFGSPELWRQINGRVLLSFLSQPADRLPATFTAHESRLFLLRFNCPEALIFNGATA